MEQRERLLDACKWHQRNDRNGDFMQMWEEYEAGEVSLDTVKDVCERVFIEIRDEHLAPEDVVGMAKMDEWVEYISLNS
jgi:hypothetical protein